MMLVKDVVACLRLIHHHDLRVFYDLLLDLIMEIARWLLTQVALRLSNVKIVIVSALIGGSWLKE
jgi:hypothetical protein